MGKNRDFRENDLPRPRNGNGYNRGDNSAAMDSKASVAQSQTRHDTADGVEDRRPSSFAARFGRAIAQHGIAAIPSALFHYQGRLDLSAQEVWFISYVMCFKWDESLPRVNLSQMEKRVGMGKRSLYRLKERLCEADYLKVFPVYTESGRQDCSAYDFSGLFEEIERLILADPPKANPIHTDEDSDVEEEPVEHDMSFLARFGRVIARYGVAAVPQAIFTYQASLGLRPQQVWFISYIFSYQWKKALPYPSIVKMAARTGYSTVQLHEIKASLVAMGYLRLVPRATRYGGRDSNAYDFSGLFDAIRNHLQREHTQNKGATARPANITPEPTPRSRPSRRRGRAAAQRARQNGNGEQGDAQLINQGDARFIWEDGVELIPQGDVQFTWHGVAERIGESESGFTGEGGTEFTRESDATLAEEGAPGQSVRTNPKPPTRVNRSLQKRVTPGSHNVEAIQEERTKQKRDDSNHLSLKRSLARDEDRATPLPSSTYITAVMDDFSHELNDPDHKTSNATQALRLWQASKLSEQEFIHLIYEAKQLTRRYQTRSGPRGIENKMAYFFTVLRDLCGLPGDTDPVDTSKGTPEQEVISGSRSREADNGAEVSTISARQLWQAALRELQADLPRASFQTWLKNTSILAFADNTVVIAAPSTFVKEQLESRFSKHIAATLHDLLGYEVGVRFEVKAPGQ